MCKKYIFEYSKINKLYLIYILLFLFIFIVPVYATNATVVRDTNCTSILSYEGITTLVGSLMLIILGISIIIHSLKIENPTLILFGITTTIIGFGSLIMGNYLFSVIFNTLC
jgi:hypothetical protein